MQGDLFHGETVQHLPLHDAKVDYYPGWLKSQQATTLQQLCVAEMNWQRPLIRVAGKFHKIPRMQAWVGNAEAVYRFSQKTFIPEPWTPFLEKIKRLIELQCNAQFNSVLLNRYRTGTDGMGFHADDEKALGPEPVIASLSLGATRKFVFKSINKRDNNVAVELRHGDLLIMAGTTQQYWHHGLPKTQTYCEERLNLTFRFIHPTL